MTQDNQILTQTGMQFFGKMTASATHELKNNLAIINENAGLLEDLSMMAQGNRKPLEIERIETISQRLQNQVQRADKVLTKLNRFSHSVDVSNQDVDLGQTLGFVLDLASRLIEMQGAIVEVVPPASPVIVNTNLFFLENMIWRALEIACCSTGQKNQVSISFGNDTAASSIEFLIQAATKQWDEKQWDEFFTSEKDNTLARYLGLTIKTNKEKNGFGLFWPKQI
ncbi:MAG: HAMP domain-containing histidine kinase [Desulfobacteraceae bacterium]|nr:HAMP domain-containing histidine kinase [Desulfobacteraceae bacterium]